MYIVFGNPSKKKHAVHICTWNDGREVAENKVSEDLCSFMCGGGFSPEPEKKGSQVGSPCTSSHVSDAQGSSPG